MSCTDISRIITQQFGRYGSARTPRDLSSLAARPARQSGNTIATTTPPLIFDEYISNQGQLTQVDFADEVAEVILL
jgi:hypothetical protein